MPSSTDHIVTAYDADLKELEALLKEMWETVATQFADSAKAVKKLNVPLSTDVRDGDEKVNALCGEIEEKTTRIIALRQPMADDLRTVISILKISVDLERMGDHAKTMANRVAILADEKKIKSATRSLLTMCETVAEMIDQASDAYFNRDIALAEKVAERDRDVDEMNTSLFRELLTYMMENPRNIEASTHLLFMAKTVERIGDHCENMAEQVTYLVTGEQPA